MLFPAVVWLYWGGLTGWGTFLLVWSLVVVSMDNVLRPVLIRRGADLPLLLIFGGVIGGLLAFGLIGIFVGPVVLAVTYRLVQAWVEVGAGGDQRGFGRATGAALREPGAGEQRVAKAQPALGVHLTPALADVLRERLGRAAVVDLAVGLQVGRAQDAEVTHRLAGGPDGDVGERAGDVGDAEREARRRHPPVGPNLQLASDGLLAHLGLDVGVEARLVAVGEQGADLDPGALSGFSASARTSACSASAGRPARRSQ